MRMALAVLAVSLLASGGVRAETLAETAQKHLDAGRLEQAVQGFDAAVAQARAANDQKALGALLGDQRMAAGMLGTERLKARRPQEALPLYEKALAISREQGDAEGEIFDLSSVGYCLRILGKPKEATASYQAARSVAAARGLSDREAEALDQLVETALGFENLPLASDFLRASVEFNAKRGDHARVAKALSPLLWVWPETRPFFELAPVIQQAAPSLKAGGDTGAQLELALYYFDFLLTAGLYGEVHAVLTRRLTEQAFDGLPGGPALRARRLSLLARIDDARGAFPAAEAGHRAALAQWRAAKDAVNAAKGLLLLADHFRLAGQYGPALQQCEAAIAASKEADDTLGQGRGHLCRAQVLAALGKRKDSDEASGQAARFGKRVGSKSLMAASLSAAAAAFRPQTVPGLVLGAGAEEELMKSLSPSKSALDMYGEFHDAPSLAREAVLSAPTFLAMGKLEAAGTLARIGLEAGQKLGDRQTEVNALRTLAEIALAAKKQDEVRRFGAQALALAEEIGDGENVARTWDVLARAEALAGRPSGAIFFRKQAVNAVQALRSSAASLSRELRASQTRSKEALYRDLAGDLLREGRLAEAEQVLAMLKEEEFSAFIRRRSSDGDAKALRLEANAAEAPWAQRYDALREKTAALGQQLRAVKPSSALPPEVLAELFAGLLPPDAAARAAALEPQLAAARAGFDDYLAALAKASAQLAVPPGAQQQGLLQGKLGALGEGTVALYYVLLRDRLHVLLATPKGYTHREVPIAAERLAGLSAQWRVVLQQPGRDPRPGGRALYDLLVAPVEKELLLAKARTVMLALDGGLRYLPFAALYDGQQYLVQRWQFTVYTAAAGAVVDRPPRPQWTIAALGVSEAARGFESLPGVPAELADIVKKPGSATGVLPGTALLDGAFTRAALIDALRARPAVLHLASHFAFEPDGTEAESFLLLGGGKTLSLADFAAGEFPVKDLDLLTLSACQTGVGSTGRDGVEVEGFGVLAQRKGAAAVMATLWPVADASTSLFMREFYRRREVGHVTKATSVRAVQVGFITGEYGNESLPLATRGLRRTAPPAREDIAAPPFTVDPKAPFAHPYFWAPFILMGNGL